MPTEVLGDIFYEHWLPGVLAWIVIYISDYVCTVVSARMYQSYVKDHIVFEGSFELNPVFEADVNKLRWISPRFVILLVLTSLLLAGYWVISKSVLGVEHVYPGVLGAFILMECGVHMRHFRNLTTFRLLRRGGMSGQVTYERGFVLRNSAGEFLSYAILFSVISVMQSSWFFLGGAFGCFMIAVKHWVLARKWKKRRALEARVSAPS